MSRAREVWYFRDVLMAFASRIVRVKYKQAAIGIVWVVMQPLLTAMLLTLVLGRLSNVSSEGAPYLLFALSGMVAWAYFASTLAGSMDSLVAEAVLIRKVYFPREIVPLAAALAGLVDLVPGLILLLGFCIAYGTGVGWEWLALPIIPLVMALGTAAYAMVPAALNVYYRDVRYTLTFLLQLGLFASPVVWSLSRVDEPFQSLMIVINPAACGIDGLRRILLHHDWPQVLPTLGCVAWMMLVGAGGYLIFKRLERGFADRV